MATAAPMRVLATARDPGAAHQIAAIAHGMMADPRFDAGPVATGVALPIFRAAGLAPRACDAADGDWLAAADRILAEIAPDLLLCGLSGPEPGLDEALVHRARCPRVAFQDYWGFAPQGFGSLPDLYLTRDAQAAAITARNTGRRAVAVGSPRDDAILPRHRAAARAAGRARLRHADRTVLLFAGQPFADILGYIRTLDAAIAAARQVPNAWFVYLPHPKSAPQHAARVAARLADAGEVAAFTEIAEAVAAADVLITPYSSAASDLVALARAEGGPFPPPVHLLWEDDLRAIFAANSGLPEPPGVSEGYALAARSDTLAETLARALTPATQAAARDAAAQLPPPGGATARALAAILAVAQEAA